MLFLTINVVCAFLRINFREDTPWKEEQEQERGNVSLSVCYLKKNKKIFPVKHQGKPRYLQLIQPHNRSSRSPFASSFLFIYWSFTSSSHYKTQNFPLSCYFLTGSADVLLELLRVGMKLSSSGSGSNLFSLSYLNRWSSFRWTDTSNSSLSSSNSYEYSCNPLNLENVLVIANPPSSILIGLNSKLLSLFICP